MSAVFASPAAAGVRIVEPGSTFKLAKGRVIDEVRINGGPRLKVRCVGDGCDWRRRGTSKILASISELDRIFRSYGRSTLRVTTERG